jgi:hypothetical protein
LIAYVDSSVLLRVVLSQPDRLREWSSIQQPVTSALTEVECLRTLDRRFRQGFLEAGELANRRGLFFGDRNSLARKPPPGAEVDPPDIWTPLSREEKQQGVFEEKLATLKE